MESSQPQSTEFPLVFIDTNIFLDFYRSEGEAGISLLKKIDSLHEHLVTTDQIEVEFFKNRQKVISVSLDQLKAPSTPIVIPAYLSESKAAEGIDKNVKAIRDRIKKLRTRFQKVLENPANLDPVFKVVRNLVQNTSSLNLRNAESQKEQVLLAARLRFERGYPPRKRDDTSIGDALNWEWLLSCANQKERDVIVVSRDGDYGLRLDNKHYLNDWLLQEFRSRVSVRRKIEFTTVLSHALKRLSVDVTPAEEREEERIIAQSTVQEKPLISELWSKLLDSLRTNPFVKAYLSEATPMSFENGVLTIGFAPEFHGYAALIDNQRNYDLLPAKLRGLGYEATQVRFVKL